MLLLSNMIFKKSKTNMLNYVTTFVVAMNCIWTTRNKYTFENIHSLVSDMVLEICEVRKFKTTHSPPIYCRLE